MFETEIDVLGTIYKVEYRTVEEDSELEGLSGYCNYDDKEIIISENLNENARKVTMRHEVIHSFLYESGLSANSNTFYGSWAENEEMVDWFALQWCKINDIFKGLEVL